MRNSRIVRLLAVVTVLSALVAAPVGAQPSSDDIREDLQGSEERLQDLEMRAAIVVEDYNEANVALQEASAELAATGEELEELTVELEKLLEAAGDHARLLHKLGPTLELSSVFVAGGSTEIGARGAAMRRIMDIQRADFEGLEAATTSMDALEEQYAEQYEQARTQQAAVDEQREQVEATLASLEDEIATLEADLSTAEDREAEEERRRLEAEERARREAEEQARLEAEAEAQAEHEARAEREAERASQEETASEPAATSTDDAGGTSDGGSSSNGSGGDGSSGSESPPSTRQSASVAVDKALEQVGKPYRYGANGPDSFDCSGLTSYAWRHAGVDITRTSRSQWHATARVSRGQLQPGDLVFFSRDGTPGGIGHVAMYIGGGDVVEASRSGVPVRRNSSALSRSDILGYGRP